MIQKPRFFQFEIEDKEDREFQIAFVKYKEPVKYLSFFFITLYFFTFYIFYGILFKKETR
jgi:hypothetical protein